MKQEIKIHPLGHIVIVIATTAVVVGLYYVVLKAIDVPTVQMSTSTNECVKIIDKGKTFDCVELKNKDYNYTVEWVK